MLPTGLIGDDLSAEVHRRRVTVLSTLVSVRSRGSIRLRSADPAWSPTIEAGYFDDPADLDVMLAGCRRLVDICRAGSTRPSLLARRRTRCRPARATSQLVDHIRRYTQTTFHPTSTCAMGTGEDAVVDPSLKVRGVAGLRVVDASVMPAVPRGNTNAPTIMVAEKAADLIRSEQMTIQIQPDSLTTTTPGLDQEQADAAPRPPDVRLARPAHRRRRRRRTRSTPPRRSAAAVPAVSEGRGGLVVGAVLRRAGRAPHRVEEHDHAPHGRVGPPTAPRDGQLQRHADATLDPFALAIDHIAWAAGHAGKVLGPGARCRRAC